MGLMLGVETGEGGDEKRGGDLGWTLLIFEKISGTVHVVLRIAGIDSGADGLNGKVDGNIRVLKRKSLLCY
jgi:hypothetical protein